MYIIPVKTLGVLALKADVVLKWKLQTTGNKITGRFNALMFGGVSRRRLWSEDAPVSLSHVFHCNKDDFLFLCFKRRYSNRLYCSYFQKLTCGYRFFFIKVLVWRQKIYLYKSLWQISIYNQSVTGVHRIFTEKNNYTMHFLGLS